VDWTSYEDGHAPDHIEAYVLDHKAYSMPPKKRQTSLAL
jgi:hypothetical protein